MKHVSALLALALAFVVTGCAGHTKIPDADRLELERKLPGRTYYLRHAMYVGPFWTDADKLFLSDGVPGEIPYVVNPAGVPIDPPPPTAIVPAGTRVRIRRLELPTGYAVTTRNPFGPRYNTWLHLVVEGLPRDPSPVLLLPRELESHDQVMAALERWLSPDDLSPVLRQLAPHVLQAVNEKRLVEGMPAEAVAMAWGHPERKEIQVTGQSRTETWIWPFERRQARIVDGRLVSWEGEGAALAD